MYYIKIGLTLLLLLGAFSSLIYSFILFIQFLGKRLSKRDVIKRTFLVTFCGIMSIFLVLFVWQFEQFNWNILHWMFFLGVFTTISFMMGIASIAPYWAWKE